MVEGRGEIPTLNEQDDGPKANLSFAPISENSGRTVAQLKTEDENAQRYKWMMDRNEKAFRLACALLVMILVLALLDFFFYDRTMPLSISYFITAFMTVVGFLFGSNPSGDK